MAIAKNFLKFPQAMALQWPLALPKASAWEAPRPKKYQGRGFRTLLSRAAKVAARRAAKVLNNLSFAEKLERAGAIKKAVPQWWKDAKRRAQELAKKIKDSCMNLEFYQVKECDQVEPANDKADWAIARTCAATRAAQAMQAKMNGIALRNGTFKRAAFFSRQIQEVQPSP